MKRVFVVLTMILTSVAVYAQAADFIRFDSSKVFTDYSITWKTALFNQSIIIHDNKGQPLLLLCLPANGSHSPVAGVYTIMKGGKRAVKKRSQIAKIEYEPGYRSIASAGSLIISENKGIYTFSAENISIIHGKTKEAHKLTFKMAMFIQKQ